MGQIPLADAESETGIRQDAAAKRISCIESNGRARAASERGGDRACIPRMRSFEDQQRAALATGGELLLATGS